MATGRGSGWSPVARALRMPRSAAPATTPYSRAHVREVPGGAQRNGGPADGLGVGRTARTQASFTATVHSPTSPAGVVCRGLRARPTHGSEIPPKLTCRCHRQEAGYDERQLSSVRRNKWVRKNKITIAVLPLRYEQRSSMSMTQPSWKAATYCYCCCCSAVLARQLRSLRD